MAGTIAHPAEVERSRRHNERKAGGLAIGQTMGDAIVGAFRNTERMLRAHGATDAGVAAVLQQQMGRDERRQRLLELITQLERAL